MWSVLQEEESANETGCELYVNRVLITNHRRLILDRRVSPHTACARIVEISSGQSVTTVGRQVTRRALIIVSPNSHLVSRLSGGGEPAAPAAAGVPAARRTGPAAWPRKNAPP